MSISDKTTVTEQTEITELQTSTELPPLISRDQLISFVVEGVASELGSSRGSMQALADPIAKVPSGFGRSEAVEMEKPNAKKLTQWPVKQDLLGVEVSLTTYDEVVRQCVSAARRGEPGLVTFLAVHAIVTAALDPGYRYRINAFDAVTPDGQPVRWALNMLHRARLPDRVCGPESMIRLCARAAEEGIAIYLYGSSNDTLAKLKANLEEQFPAIRIVGVESPPFRDLTLEENQAACDRINQSGAGFVFIGLGCPRQDVFAHFNRNRIKAVQLCVGAAFDFHAGKKKMAPAWMQRSGTEWFYRLMQEPSRLWKRYLVTNTAFVLLMTRRLISGR